MDLYNEIFKRKSFHKFSDAAPLTAEDLLDLEEFISHLTPLEPKYAPIIRVMPIAETSCHNGGTHAIVFYDNKEGDYLRNIGYMGEQIDLYLASRNIGCCWFGLAAPKEKKVGEVPYAIMLSIGKVAEKDFRKDMFKAARKPLEDKWFGDAIVGKDYSVAEIARYAPSACNTQPWLVENEGGTLSVFRMRKPGPAGIMPASRVGYFNRIDMGIYLYILETCLNHEDKSFTRTLFTDLGKEDDPKTLNAQYNIANK